MLESNQPDPGVRAGDVIAGKYRVERVLGAGGMGVVVAAHHTQLDTRVAIKMLLPELLTNVEAVERFAREARAVAKITSEHVARISDVGTLENGVPYMVMEYLEGEDLDQWLQRRGPLEIEQAVEFIVQACVAVAEAHGLGIVHRDLKPANLFCIRRPDGQLAIKVLDFGISKMANPIDGAAPQRQNVTKKFAVMGSPFYMAPEQMKASRHADAQSDVWALGVILFELLSGQLPFVGESETDVAIQVASSAPRSLREFRPEVPPALEAIVLRCLAKPKHERFLDVAELATALAPFAPARARGTIDRIAGTLETARLAQSGANPAASVEVDMSSWTPPEVGDRRGPITLLGHTTGNTDGAERSPSRTKWIAAAAAIVSLFVVGGAVVFVMRASAGAHAPLPSAASTPPAVTLEPPHEPPPTASPAPPASIAAPNPPPMQAAPAAAAPADRTPEVHVATSAAGRTTPAKASPVGPAPRHAISCDPPFTLDQQGRKHFKPECF